MSGQSSSILIVACEQSGDNYGALLAEALRRERPDLELFGIGGPRMQAAGVRLLVNMLEHSATGIVEVLASARFFLRTMDEVVQEATTKKASCAVLIDSPDFNLRIAPRLKVAGIPVAYYVSPQVWAWRPGRASQIQRVVDELMVIFPFEMDWYKARGIDAHFVGHPLLDLLDLDATAAAGRALRQQTCGSTSPVIGLLPGSRKNEVLRLLPRFLEAAHLITQELPTSAYMIGCAQWLTPERVAGFTTAYPDLRLHAVHGRTHEVMAGCDYLLTCSGTATLEAALLGTPQLMAYRLAWPTWAAANLLVSRRQFFCMPNIVLNAAVVPELIQTQATPRNMAQTAIAAIKAGPEQSRAAGVRLRSMLGGSGASVNAARRVLALVDG